MSPVRMLKGISIPERERAIVSMTIKKIAPMKITIGVNFMLSGPIKSLPR